MVIQPKSELEEWYSSEDPWKYRESSDDANRRSILLAEIPNRHFRKVLDIGCGEGFVTGHLPGERVVGVDISEAAVGRAAEAHRDPRFSFQHGSIFDLPKVLQGEKFDLVLITGVMYQQYIGNSELLIYDLIDQVLEPEAAIISVHISSWYRARFPYLMLKELFYPYRQFTHCLQVYTK